jgi:hypothetical protein
MKKLICVSVLSLAICPAFKNAKPVGDPSEKKDLKSRSDYRDTYLGNYFCRRATTVFSANDIATISKDTLTISVTKADLDSILTINFSGKVYQFKLKRGLLYAYPEGGRHGGKLFASDSIWLVIPVGHASSSNYLGKKR